MEVTGVQTEPPRNANQQSYACAASLRAVPATQDKMNFTLRVLLRWVFPDPKRKGRRDFRGPYRIDSSTGFDR